MKATPRMRKIALLGKFAYPGLRLFSITVALTANYMAGLWGQLRCWYVHELN
ncbi:hypothetical protein PAUR_a2099 [Pseudoalteromonas aurantia 208]|uniref:Uncharacterized protein n=1 Tax=Pseudoalteromonas aurantia 208 TaxID=1314867 RepID=A0ABR9EBY1_9GAMM|nr:hypothetical protein [Pseudoalteromonas aurantia 208]